MIILRWTIFDIPRSYGQKNLQSYKRKEVRVAEVLAATF